MVNPPPHRMEKRGREIAVVAVLRTLPVGLPDRDPQRLVLDERGVAQAQLIGERADPPVVEAEPRAGMSDRRSGVPYLECGPGKRREPLKFRIEAHERIEDPG